MKIAMVSEHASPLAVLGGVDAGGQNVHVAALARHLALRGHRVEVYTRRDAAALAERVELCPGATVVHVPVGPARAVPKDDLYPMMADFGRWMEQDWLTRGRPDVVHAHFWMSGLAALAATRRWKVPVVQTFHALGAVKRRHQGAADTSPPDRIEREREIARDVDLVIATCTDEVDELGRMGVPPDRVRVVPCGVDTEHFHPGAGCTGSQYPRLLTVGRLVERKGIDTAVRALALLPEARLVVAGGLEVERLDADPEAARLRAVALELGVHDRVELVGQVPHEQMPQLYRGADVVLATPWYEPFGITPLEAAACGRPVVGSAVGGLLDSVVDGSTGALVPPRDPYAVAAAVRALLDDPDRARRWGVNARQRAVTTFGWPQVARATDEALTGLVRASRSRRAAAEQLHGVSTAGIGPTNGHTSAHVTTGEDPITGGHTTTATITTPERATTIGHATGAGITSGNGHGDVHAGTNGHFARKIQESSGGGGAWLRRHATEVGQGMAGLMEDIDLVESWGAHLARVLAGGGRLLAAGNGGSAAEAQHLTAELVGRFLGERRPLSALSLCSETSSLTAILNDYGADEVFARQVEAHGRRGDVLVLLSTSGRSPNVLAAAERGRELGLTVWAMTGPAPNPLAAAADQALAVPADSTAAVQEIHLVAVHALCAALDAALAELPAVGEPAEPAELPGRTGPADLPDLRARTARRAEASA